MSEAAKATTSGPVDTISTLDNLVPLFEMGAPSSRIPNSFPSTWFKATRGKPRVIVKVPTTFYQRGSKNYFCNLVYKRERVPEWSLIQALAYFSRQDKATVPADETLTSFGIKLHDASGSVFIETILDYSEEEDTAAIATQDVQATWTDSQYYYALVICMMSIRIDRENHAMGKTRLLDKFSAMIPQMKNSTTSILIRSQFITPSQNLRKVMAAVDLQLNYMDREPIYKYLRLGTIITFRRDQSFLEEISYVSRILGLKPTEMVTWILNKNVAREVYHKFMRSGEEVEFIHSYASYMIDMGLSNKSPYSVSENPLTHMWVHIIGVLLGSERSYKAIHLENVGYIGQIFLAAAMVAFRFWVQAKTEGLLDRDQSQGSEDSCFGDVDLEDIKTPTKMVHWAKGRWQKHIFSFVDQTLANLSVPMRKNSMGSAVMQYWKSSRNFIASTWGFPISSWVHTTLKSF